MDIIKNRRQILSSLWVMLTVNFIFCDVFSLMHAPDLQAFMTGVIGGIALTQGFLLSFSVIMEIPMIMIPLSLVLPRRVARPLTVVTGLLLAVIQVWSLTTGGVTLHYLFFSVVEIATALTIAWLGWSWRAEVV